MILGHTKFKVDRLFSKIAISYNRFDIFNVDNLAAIVGMHAHVTIDADGSVVRQWREKLGHKFTKLPGICALHNFVIVKHINSGDVVLRVRQLCYTGSFESSKMKIARGVSTTLEAIPQESDLYKATNQCLHYHLRKWKI